MVDLWCWEAFLDMIYMMNKIFYDSFIALKDGLQQSMHLLSYPKIAFACLFNLVHLVNHV